MSNIADRIAARMAGDWWSKNGTGLIELCERVGLLIRPEEQPGVRVYEFADGSAIGMQGDWWDVGMMSTDGKFYPEG